MGLFPEALGPAARQADRLGVRPRSLTYLAEIVRRGGAEYAAQLPEPLPTPEQTKLALPWLLSGADDERLARWLDGVAALIETRRLMPDLAARFGRLGDEYESRKRSATALVEAWDWYTWPGLDPRPLHFERDLLKPGRRLDARPPVDRDVLRIGFDAQGRVAVVEEYSGFLQGRLYDETFFRHGGAVAEAAHFATDGPIYLHEYHFEDGLMRSADMVARGGRGQETYAYTDGRISRVEIEHHGRPYAVLVAEHDDNGLLRLVQVAGRESQVRYARPPADFDLDTACRTVEDMLVALILEVAAGLAVEDPIACLALSYDRPAELLIGVSAATADERATLSSIEPRAAWSPADFETSSDIDLDDAGPSLLLRQELTLLDADDADVAAGSEIGRRLLCAVAARLNQRDWSATLPVTDDFVVYPVDLELVDLERNLTRCLPPDRLTMQVSARS